MIIELGHFSLILACALGIVSLLGFFGKARWALSFLTYLTHAKTLLLGLSILCLSLAFIRSDFSVLSVAYHSNAHSALIYKIAALWGHPEGSMLLWTVILALHASLFTLKSKDANAHTTLPILHGILLLFSLYTLFAANPFERLMPFPLNAGGLNPMLQDPSLSYHPILLYLGFLGFSVPFALTAAQYLRPTTFKSFIALTKPWIYLSWTFLTLGIISGSWWAYYELGWGGWWSWDPVENASLLPWLCATALLHAQRKNTSFFSIGFLTAFCFLLCIASTWIIRGGVVVSVHSFSLNPTRSIFLLTIFLVCLAFCLPALKKIAHLENPSNHRQAKTSNPFKTLGTYVLLYLLGILLWGVFAPIAHEKIMGTALSLNTSYFKGLFCYPMLGAFLIMAWGPSGLRNLHKTRFIISLALTLLIMFFLPPLTLEGNSAVGLSLWVIVASTLQFLSKKPHIPALTAHLGIGCLALGACLNHFKGQETLHTLKAGDHVHIKDIQITLEKIQPIPTPTYLSYEATFTLKKDGTLLRTLKPERRVYFSTQSEHCETAIYRSGFSTLSLTLGETHDRSLWLVHIYENPFIILIWLGGIIVACSGIMAFVTRRRRS